MKPTARLRHFLLSSFLLAAPSAHAADFYWDQNGTTSGFGIGTGNWAEDNTSPGPGRWTTSNTGVLAGSLTQTTGNADTFNFGTATLGLSAGTIAVSGAVNMGSTTYGAASGAIVLSGGTINFGAANTITVNNASNTINSVIGGAATSLTKAGSGTLILDGNNTFNGTTIVSAGTLALTGASTGTGAITLNGGTLNLGNGGATGSVSSTVLNLSGGSFSYTRNDSATETFTTTNINNGLSTINVASGNTLNLGTVTRAVGVGFDLSATGAGTLAADTASNTGGIMGGFTFGNTWAVANGAGVAVSGLTSFTLSSGAGTTGSSYTGNNIDVDSSEGVLDAAITANSLRFSEADANTMTLTGANAITTGGILIGSGVGANLSTITGGTLAGAASKDLSVYQNNTSGGLTIASNIINNGGATALTKSGAGQLTLSGNNTFTGGLTIHAGNVVLGNAGALNSTAGSENAVTFGSGSTGTLVLGGNSVVVRSLSNTAGSPIVENANATPATLTIGNSGNAASTWSGVIRDGTGGGALTLAKSGTGKLDLYSANTYTGGTTINAGTIEINNAGSFGGTGIITFAGNGTIQPVHSSYPTLANGIQVNPSVTGTLYVDNQFFQMTYTGPVTGSGTLVQLNGGGGATGSVTLSNIANTFTGILQLAAPNTKTSSLTVNSLADSANPIRFTTSSGAAAAGNNFTLGAGAATPLLFNSRQIELASTTGTAGIYNNNGTATNTITINTNLLITANGAKTLLLGGSNIGANTFAGTIGNSGAGATSFTKADGGRWILSNTANTYTGITTISGGILEVAKLDDGSSNSSIGASGSGAGNLLLGNGATLRYTGSGDDTNRGFTINVVSNNHGAILDASGTGAVEFTNTASPAYGTTNQPRYLTLTGNNTGNNTLAANLADNGVSTNAVSLNKTGIGTWVLSGANVNTGNTTISGGGKLVLDYGTNDNSKIAGVLTLTNGAGDITLRGGSHLDAVGSLAITTGGGHASIAREVGSTAKIAFNAISRTQSGYVTMSLAEDGLATTTSAVFNGILTGGITVGSNWAKVDAGNIVALTAGDYTTLTAAAVATTTNYQLTGSLTRGAANLNSLRIVSDGDDQVLNMGAGNFQSSMLASTLGNGAGGGILYAGGGNNKYTITGSGTLSGQNANQEVPIHVHTGTLTVDMIIATGSQGPSKAGAGTLVLTKANTYTGPTFVNQGALQLRHNTASGTTAGGVFVANNAALELANSVAIGAEALTITGNGSGSNTGALRNVASNTSSYAGVITIGSGGARINSDTSGALTLGGGVVTSLFNDVTFGGAGNTSVQTAAISGAGGLVKDGTGTTILSATNTYTGATRVGEGTMNVSAGNINTTSSLTVSAGAKLAYNSSTALTVAPTLNGTGTGVGQRAVLGGTGTIGASVTLNNLGDTLSPGNSPGIQTYTPAQTWASFSYDWEVNDFDGLTAGTNFDQIAISNTLNLTGGSGSYILNILSLTAGNVDGLVPDFSEINRSWTILTSTGITGFDALNWTLVTDPAGPGAFTSSPAWGGTWALAQSGNDLVLTYTAVPEPRAALLGGLGMLMLLRRRR